MRTIEEYEIAIKKRDEYERLRDRDYPKSDHAYERAIELLKSGVTVEEIPQGFLVNDKFIVASQAYKWRIKGKGKWYYFKNIEHFVNNYVK